MNKIITIKWRCVPCKLTVEDDVSPQLQILAFQHHDRMCCLCGMYMTREFIHGEVEMGYRIGLDNGAKPSETTPAEDEKPSP